MNRKIIWAFLSVFCLFACTEVNDLVQRDDDGVVVSFTAPGLITGEVGATTRADVKLAEDSTVRILVYHRTGANANMANDTYINENTYKVKADGTLEACVVNDNGEIIAGPAKDLRLIQGKYDFYAITPAIKAVQETSTSAHKVSVHHGRDYATSLTQQKEVTTTSGAVTLDVLDRKCSKVDFAVAPKYTNVNELTIKEATLELMAKGPIEGYVAKDLPAATDNTDKITVPSGMFSNDATAPANTIKVLGSTIVLPKSNTDFKLGLEVYYNGSSTSTVLTPAKIEGLAFKKGTRYTFSIKLNGGNVTLNLTVSGWTDVNLNVDDLGATNSITVTVGSWSDVNFNTSLGGGNVDVSTGSWQPDVNWDVTLETNPGLTAEGTFIWEDANLDSSTGGGNVSGNGDGWTGDSSVDSSTGGGNINGGGPSWGTGGSNDATTGNGNSTTNGGGAQWGGDTSVDSSTGSGNVNGSGPSWSDKDNSTNFEGENK
ncbi:BF2992 family fimbrillin-A clan protein [Bacteroides sp.]